MRHASSPRLVAAGSSNDASSARALTDGDAATVWSEGRPGTGAGEFVVLRAPADIPIVIASPPTVQGQAAANMGAEGVGNIVGTVHIATFHLNAQSKPDEIDGTVSAGGADNTGNGVAVTGTFTAPVCD